MRILIALMLAAAIPAWAASASSEQEAKGARKAFEQGIKLEKQNKTDAAFQKFSEAAELDPSNVEYLTAREVARQKLVQRHVEDGNQALLQNDRIHALGEFRAASQLDPSNQFALERMRQAFSEPEAQPSRLLQIVEASDEIVVQPRPGRQSIHYRGDSRGLMEQVARSFGLSAIFDDNFNARPVNFDADNVDFLEAISLAGRFAKAMWSPLSEAQIFVAQDTAENHRQFDRMSLRTFYLPDVATPQEMNEVVSVLRGLFEIRHLVPNAGKSTLTVRAPKRILDAATIWLNHFGSGRPQVMLDLRVYQVNESMMQTLGIGLPLQFQAFNIPASALQLVQQPDVQQLINDLIANGGLNQANTAAISALLAQLQNQQSNPLLSQSFFAFGGGLTLFGVTVPPLTISASLDKSKVSSLEHMTLRAAEGNAATFRVGDRFPVLNGTFSPLVNTPAINDLLKNQTFIAPFPSFTYEDLGITLKATPQVHESPESRTEAGFLPEITLNLDLNLRSLTGTSLNGIPVISTRQLTAVVRLREGEPAVLAGMLSHTEQRSLSGPVGLGAVPIFGRALSNENKSKVEDEILMVITPYIVRSADQVDSTELWLPAGS